MEEDRIKVGYRLPRKTANDLRSLANARGMKLERLVERIFRAYLRKAARKPKQPA